MRKIIAATTLLFISGCTTVPLSVSSDTCFNSTDVLRYNSLLLRLQPDGSYRAIIQGDIGVRATAKGTWKEAHKNILLNPSSGAGEGLPTSLERASHTSLIAHPIPGAYDYKWAPMKQVACGPN